MIAEGWTITAGDLAVPSPYLTARIQRFGVYASDEIALPPGAYDAAWASTWTCRRRTTRTAERAERATMPVPAPLSDPPPGSQREGRAGLRPAPPDC